MGPNNKCVVIVPYLADIDQGTELALQEMFRRGYHIRRCRGYSDISLGRSVLASEALRDGYDEIMWVDSDVNFHPDDVEKLRAHNLPMVCGIYARKDGARFAVCFDQKNGKPIVHFGTGGGLFEVYYAGGGFNLVRREVYESLHSRPDCPVCNVNFGENFRPYYLPMVRPDEDQWWYLSEDFSFCERAKQHGYKIWADTSMELIHVGRYGWTWRDVKFREGLPVTSAIKRS